MSNQMSKRYEGEEIQKYQERQPFLQIPIFECPPDEYFREANEQGECADETKSHVIIIDL